MRILLKLVLDCTPDAAWRAIRSPATFASVSAPFTTFESLESEGFPESWGAGDHPVEVKALGLVPIGQQVIGISFPDAPHGVRMMRDTGRGLNGSLALITRWEHTMAVSSATGGRTLYRDRLVFEAGSLAVLLWPVYWAFWQWRAIGLRRLAPGWERVAD
jgi:hypothetical protein